MRTSGEKEHISNEAKSVQSVSLYTLFSYPHIRSLSGLDIYMILLSVIPWRH